MRISDWSSGVCSSDLLAQLEAIHLVTALVEHRHQPNFGAFAAGGGDVGMHGRAAVAAGLLRQSVLERAGDVGLVEDVERAEGIGDEHRAVDQVVGQPESGDAYEDRKSTRLNSSH